MTRLTHHPSQLSPAVRNGVAVLLFGLLVVLSQSALDPTYLYDRTEYLFRPYDMKGLMKVGVYLSVYGLSILALFAVVLSRSLTWCVVFLGAALFCAGMNLFYQLLGSPIGFTGEELELIIQEIGQASNALSTYANLLVRALLFVSMFLLIAVFVRRLMTLRVSSLWLLLVPLSVAGSLFASRTVGDITLFYFPPLQNVLATATDRFVLDPDKLVFFARDEVEPLQSTAAGDLPQHILFIIDESVNGIDLSINGYARDTTPWLQSVLGKRDDIVNFGVANSVSNASAWSNLILRIGLTPDDVDDFKRRLAHLPTFFQYARAAGFRTMLIDAQAEDGELQNHLSYFDKKSIDSVVYKNPEALPYERDTHLLDDYLETIRQTQDKTFTVFVRTGAHWPWADKYPPDAEIFKPAQRSTFGGMTLENKDAVTNTYLNTLRFNVDGFFKVMIDKLTAQGVWTAYTSDHGVSIFEDGTPRTHGSFENVPHGQLAVPLMIFGDGAVEEFPVSTGARFSQFQIFPTLLEKMGYPATIVDRYGPSLHEPWPINRARTTYIAGRDELIPFESLN